MNKNFSKKFREIVSDKEIKYFYHITNHNPDDILNEGLYMIENNIYTTAIEIPIEFIEDPINYSKGEIGNFYRKNAKIVLIGIEKEMIDDFILPTTLIPDSWTHDLPPNYYIPSSYIIGYINTDNMEIVINDNYDLNFEYGLK